MFLYRAFGLTVASELACPELRVGAGAPDVEIRFSPHGETASGSPASGFDAAPGYFELRVPRVARFLVSEGRSIAIAPYAGADEDSIRLFLLGSAIGALLHQRAILPLHGSAVCKDGRSLLILGTSGVGKSSLAAALCRFGWRFQSDDISPVHLDGGRVCCAAGFPRQKMWPDSLTMLGEMADRFDRVRPNLEKRSMLIADAAFHDAATPVGAVVVLGSTRERAARIAPVEGPRRMALLKRQIFRAHLPTRFEMHVKQFEVIAALSRQAPVWQLQRPRADGSPIALAEFLVSHLDVAATRNANS